MDFIVLFLLLLAVISLAAFIFFQPDYPNKRAISVYNITMITINVFITLMFFLYMKFNYQGTIDDEWWLFMALCGSFILFAVISIVTLLVRNFYLFRSSSQNFYKRGRW